MATPKETSGPCPVARGLDCVGDRWSMLVLRDVERGLRRFDLLQTSLGIAPNVLSSRLAALVGEGLIEKRRYNERPPRYEYVLTDAGRDFIPILAAIGAWGRKYRGTGPLSRLVDRQTGLDVEPEVIDRVNGVPIGSRPLDLVLPEG
ncbi:MAG: helix-turn-helix domain-containing protein [Candidatus Andeanibacterium colombiense]|uniref:Helix-turn-helix domain-containing protein n=1 Tax=Candidatus Andeanibacterium colombiense TaxID=3121345 RepID=A0AAJ6BNN4_9SPHN|nr:MAG: helix-turn-helix domain-containing protein [Sphingomonadaceae bacterium]